MRVLVIGAGAIGSFYGSLLARAGMRVGMWARTDHALVRRRGIDLSSEAGLGAWHFAPAPVIADASEISEMPDVAMLCVKVLPDLDRAALLRPVLGEHTAIFLLCNGIEIEDAIAAAFPGHELISGLAFVCVTRTAPGLVRHQAYGRLALGNHPRGAGRKVNELAAAFQQAGVPCEVTADIVAARWRKCLWNAAFNPLSVLSGGLTTAEILAAREPLVRAIMNEVLAIAHAQGHVLNPGLIDQQIASTRQMPPYKTSMLLDFEAGRPMETEAILGNAVRAGRRAGLQIPGLESVYARMKLTETRSGRPWERP